MYWWTNRAAPETARTRVLAPADTAILHTPDAGLTLRDLASAPDASFPGRAKHASELFFRVKEGRRPWIAALEPDGHGLAQVSTGRLLGRKAFYWGMNAGGRRWQHLLGGPGAAYLEIQAGLARTQLESVPMPALAEWCWTEAFGPLDCPEAAGQTDWDSAWRAADREMGARLPAATLAEADRELAACAARRPVEVLARGSGWGALERLRLAAGKQPDPIPAELEFGASGPEQAPWIALLDAGRLPEQPPDEGPGAFMVQAEWRRLIENALAAGGGDHWLSWLHLGNMRCEAFDLAGARDAWVESVRRRSNSWALRNLAWLQKRAGNAAEARRLMAEAWDRGPRPAALAIEVAASLADVADWPKLAGFIAGLPGELRAGDRIRMLEARAAIEIGDYRAAESLLAGEFALVREGETTLSDLWFMLNERRTAAQEGAVIDDEFRRRIRAQFPPPPNLDFRMSGRA
jgi:hypothetical protein